MPPDPERRALAAVCERLRDQVRATHVAVWTLAPRALVVAIDDGRTPEPARSRVLPIRYGAEPIGELTWQATDAPSGPPDAAVMGLGADLLGPFLAALHRWPAADAAAAPFGLVGISDAIVQLRAGLSRAASAPFPVLIEGESGVGKELVARAVHAASGRRGPFVAVNCAALAEDLLDAELFGHARGAFTGAAAERRGLFEEAHGGTFFLDEVAELSSRGQAKLLRVLQEGELRRLGENAARRVDVRLVAASNRPLHAEVQANRFRADLRFRLDVVRLRVPPLRERREDIAVLAAHFWQAIAAATGSQARLAPSLLAALAAADWPGNARELQNAVATIAVHAPRRGLVRAADVPAAWGGTAAAATASLAAARRAFEASFVRAALARCGQRPAATARELGVTRQGLAKLMARLDVRATPPPLTRAM